MSPINGGARQMQYDAVILAGGESTSELKKIAPYDNEALIIIGNYPMIYYVFNALRDSNRIRNIVISGPVEALRNIFPRQDNLFFATSGQDAIESFSHAVNVLQEQDEISEKILILPTDIPFITTAAIEDFISQCESNEADFYYPVTSKEVNEVKFPGVSRTYVNLKEGTFTGGNLFFIRTRVIDQCLDIGLKLVKRRKNPVAMARLFGFALVWKFVFKQLGIPMIKQRFYEVTGIKGEAIISQYAEVGVDVDKPSDLTLAQQYLAAK
ncbi:MAG: nucleotidyltransferase family protein [Syntrophomonas sp.]